MAVSCFGRDAAGAGSAESRSPAGLKRSIRYACGGIRLGCFSNDDGPVVGRTAVPEQASVGHANSIGRFAFHHFMRSLIRENRAACGAISSPRCSESKASWTTRSMIVLQNRRTGWQTLRPMAGSQPVGGGLPKASASWPGCGLASHGLRRVSRARNGQIIDLATLGCRPAPLQHSSCLIRRQVKPRADCGSGSPSRTSAVRPVGEPNTFSSSYRPWSSAGSPG